MGTAALPAIAAELCRGPQTAGRSCRQTHGLDPHACNASSFCEASTKLCTPKRKAGAACTQLEDCEGGLYCEKGKGAPVCAAFVLEGKPCGVPVGLSCGPARFCAGAVCLLKKPAGAVCSGPYDCLDPLRCTEGRCTPPGRVGQRCAQADACADGLRCDTVLGLCFDKPVTVESGGACTGQKLLCPAGESCSKGEKPGRCLLPRLGGPCTAHHQCPRGAWCHQLRCAQADGENDCQSIRQCGAGFWCAGDRCRPQGKAGASCRWLGAPFSGECAPPLHCQSAVAADAGKGRGECGSRSRAGERCGADDDCFFPFICREGACVRAGHIGEPCANAACRALLLCGPCSAGGCFCLEGACDVKTQTCTDAPDAGCGAGARRGL